MSGSHQVVQFVCPRCGAQGTQLSTGKSLTGGPGVNELQCPKCGKRISLLSLYSKVQTVPV